jgi:elongation factor Ts
METNLRTKNTEETVSGQEISAGSVAELRRETGAGMMDCKKALAESGGDKAKALEYLRKKGKAAAEKRADRSADQGVVVIRVSDDGRNAALVEVNSETDFVARNESFRAFAADVAAFVLAWRDAAGKTADDLKDQTLPSGVKIGDALTDLTGKIGEKLVLGKFARVQAPNGFIGTYVHSDSKLGSMVVLDGADGATAGVQTLGRDLAMQVAAMPPLVVRREDVPADKIEYERGMEIERARAEGKPEPAVAKIAEGRINKWLAEVALMEQAFVKDPKVVIRDLVAATGKQIGADIRVQSYIRVRVGESS